MPPEGTWPGRGHTCSSAGTSSRRPHVPGARPPQALPAPQVPPRMESRIVGAPTLSGGRRILNLGLRAQARRHLGAGKGALGERGLRGARRPAARSGPGVRVVVGVVVGDSASEPPVPGGRPRVAVPAGTGSLLPPSGGQKRCRYLRGRPRPSSSGSWPRGCRRSASRPWARSAGTCRCRPASPAAQEAGPVSSATPAPRARPSRPSRCLGQTLRGESEQQPGVWRQAAGRCGRWCLAGGGHDTQASCYPGLSEVDGPDTQGPGGSTWAPSPHVSAHRDGCA